MTAAATSVATTTAAAAVAAATTVATATAAAISTASATTVPAAAATTTWFAFAGFVDDEGSAVDIEPVQGIDHGAGVLVGGHFDETEAAGTARFTVGNHTGAGDATMFCKEVFQIGAGIRVGEVPHVEFLGHSTISLLARETKKRKSDPGKATTLTLGVAPRPMRYCPARYLNVSSSGPAHRVSFLPEIVN